MLFSYSNIFNFDLRNITTPINPDYLESLLRRSHYDADETHFLVHGFRNGFDIGYSGPEDRQDTANNIPLKVGVGSTQDMWDKIMKEVKLKRFAGPFRKIPFKNYIQSPIGLVPKSRGQTRLILHLSNDFNNGP